MRRAAKAKAKSGKQSHMREYCSAGGGGAVGADVQMYCFVTNGGKAVSG